jgi:hypothetical protein
MNRTLRWTGLVCLGAWLLAPAAYAQPILAGPATNSPEPAKDTPEKSEQPSTLYLIKKNGEEASNTANAKADDNATARPQLDGRQLALEQFRQGNEALRRGYAEAAEAFFEPLKTNPHLTLQERRQVVRICEQIHQRDQRRTEAATHVNKTMAPRPDPDTLLADGRRAFEMKNFDQAETLARQSQLAGYTSYLPWSDTPTKLLKDIQTARARELGKSVTPAQAQVPPRNRASDPLTPPASPGALAKRDNKDPRFASARRLLEQAFLAARNGDTQKARQILHDVETLKLSFAPTEPYTPEKVRLEITRVELAAKSKQMDAGGAVQQAVVRPGNATDAADTRAAGAATRPADPSSASGSPDAKLLVAEARRHYQAGRHDQAVALAKQAQLTPGARWGHFEDSPEKIIHDVTKARQEQNEKKAAELLLEARRLLTQNKCDEAEKLTFQAEALRSDYPAWHTGERHDKLRQEIAERRRALAKPSLPPLLDPVPPPLVAALKPAPSGPKPLLEPRKPASEIIASSSGRPSGELALKPESARPASPMPAEQPLAVATEPVRSGRPDAPGRSEAPPTMFSPLESGPSADVQPMPPPLARPGDTTGRRKASQLLGEARQQQKEGLLVTARALYDQVKTCHAAHGPEDDISDEQLTRVYHELRRDAAEQVQQFSAAVQTLMSKGAFKEAERYLQYMQQLSAAYDLAEQAPGARPGSGVVQASAPVPPTRFAEDHVQAQGPVNVTVIINANSETPVLVNDPGRRATVVQPPR